MSEKIRKHFIPLAGVAFVLLLAVAAFAVQGLDQAQTRVPESVELPTIASEKKAEPATEEGDGVSVTQAGAEDNHGACVSKASQDETLEGWRQGMFVSLVAQDEDMTGSDCDYSEHLEAASEMDSPGHGDNGNGNGAEASSGGRSFGESKAEEGRDRGDEEGS